MRVAATLLIVSLAVSSFKAFSHASDDLIPLRLTVAEWASAYQSDNLEELSDLLSDDFNGSPAGKSAYLARLPLLPVKKVILRYATYNIDNESARVSSIVHMPYRELYIPFSLSMSLEKEGSEWKITSITESDELPPDLVPIDHPHLHVTYEKPVAVRDSQTGEPVHSRVHIRDENGAYWPPQGHRKVIAEGWREDIGGDVIVAGKTYAYVDPDFVLPLPEGRYTMEIMRGPEYIPQSIDFKVDAGPPSSITVRLDRWINMAARGWYSGDSHTHFLEPHTALQEARGEDLNVINVLSSSGGNLITQIHQFTGAPSVLSDDKNIVYISEETRHDYLGHTVLLGLKEHVFPFGWGGPLTGVHGGFDYPTMAHQADKAHAQEGALVAWSHLPHPHGELPIDVALGKIDAVEAMVFGSPFDKHPVRVRMGELTPTELAPIDLWYNILNTGFNMPALGSTDKMWNSQVAGSVRTYVEVEGEFTYQNWVEGIRAGRTQFSSGPVIFFSVEGRQLGDTIEVEGRTSLHFTATVESLLPVDTLEIVVNGAIAASIENPKGEQKVTLDGAIDIGQSAWIAARAYSAHRFPTQAQLTGDGSPLMAHTSPIYISVNNQPRTSPESAKYLLRICDQTIRWAKTMARYQNEEQRMEVVALYERARNLLAQQVAD